ncbi:MAG: hypothetical protein LBQ22_12755 [Bacteroidales bacterium]|jgi:hypothetical protein|nr:hypothetical protein [Bacteroidales bacterium]
MKTKTLILSVVLLVLPFFNYAQESTESENIGYSNITEMGFQVTSPRGVAFEVTTINGICFNKKHSIGIGVGIGVNDHNTYSDATAYNPIFLNYRLYFKPGKTFSPHVNLAAGGMIAKDGGGLYSSLTAGFRAGVFSFSSGLSLFAVQREKTYQIPYEGYYTKVKDWYYPFGITIKVGFSF